MNRFKDYRWIWALTGIVWITGLFLPDLMDFDAAEYAGIAMHMFTSGDMGTLLNRNYDTGVVYDYLDKPHVLYWSAMPGFSIFGVTDHGYRLVSVLMTLAAAWATYRIGSLLYSIQTGKIAAVFFITAQTILLANHDVRTDTLLTAFTTLAIYHLLAYLVKTKWIHLVYAGAFLAAAVGTKGMIAVIVAGSTIGAYLVFRPGGLKKLLHWHWLVLPLAFFVCLSPVLYFYYQQFDLHPEKLVNGSTGMSGVKFILWTQSFERFAGDRALVDNPEFSFFFHSFLWIFLPWSILAYTGSFQKLGTIFRTRGAWLFRQEQLTFAGVWAVFFLMSLSSFKLPHYLNILIPLFSVFTASWLTGLEQQGKQGLLLILSRVQWGVAALLLLLSVVLFGWAFPLTNVWIIGAILLLIAGSIYWYRRQNLSLTDRVWIPSAITVLLVNFVLNTHFYPQIDRYQGGSSMAKWIKAQSIPVSEVYVYHKVYRTFDFYLGTWRPMLDNKAIAASISRGEKILLFTDDNGKAKLDSSFFSKELHRTPDYHITQLNGKFINPATRPQSHGFMYLLQPTALRQSDTVAR